MHTVVPGCYSVLLLPDLTVGLLWLLSGFSSFFHRLSSLCLPPEWFRLKSNRAWGRHSASSAQVYRERGISLE